MTQRYQGVDTGYLIFSERRVPVDEAEIPLVIRARGGASSAFLREFLASHSMQINQDIARYGAVLLRGFDIKSYADFQAQVLSIRGMRGMSEVLMSEPGRTLREGTNLVFHTNALFKTGSSLKFGMFHTENYFSPDVPRYVSFFCRKSGRVGGETGLINTAKVYADLPEATRSKLEARSCLVSLCPFLRAPVHGGQDSGIMTDTIPVR